MEQNTFRIAVKNMVCYRCIKVITEGFELVEDKEAVLINQVKSLINEYIHYEK